MSETVARSVYEDLREAHAALQRRVSWLEARCRDMDAAIANERRARAAEAQRKARNREIWKEVLE